MAITGFSIAINLLMLVSPLYMMQVYDRVLTSRSLPTLVALTGLALALLAVMAALEFVRSRIMVRISAWLDAALNRPMFEAAFRDRVAGASGSAAQPLRDLDSVRTFLTGPALLAVLDAPWTPLFILVIFLLHPLLGFVATGGALLLFALALVTELATRDSLTKATRASHAADGFAEASLRNTEAVHAMGMLPGLFDRWTGFREAAVEQQQAASERAGAISSLTKFVRPALQVGMLAAGAYLAVQQIITPGAMIASSIILGRALAPVEAAIGSWRSLVLGRAAYRRLSATLRRHPVLPPSLELPPPKGRLAVEALHAAAPGQTKPILRAVTFSLEAGEMLGVIGPSGAGKSSLARVLGGAWLPLAGNVRLDGADLVRWPREAVGPYIGYLPQDVELFDGSVGDNIARFGALDAGKVVAAAQAAGAHDMILRLPAGYDTSLGEAGQLLSGGQRQRIGLARALYGDPRLLVLDEPNANLDAEGEEALVAALAVLKANGRTVIVIAHRPSLLANADRVLVLRNGTVEHFGPRQEVMAKLRRPVPAAAEGGKMGAVVEPLRPTGRSA